jgi:hypothetical protein
LQHSREKALWLTITLMTVVGCNRHDPELARRLVGTWRVDMELTEPNLRDSLAEAKRHDSDLDVDALRTQLTSWMLKRRMIFTETRLEDWSGDEVERSRYEVLRGGANYIVIREYPDDMPEYHDMTLQEIVDDINIQGIGVPMCDGIVFLDENHFRTFKYKVRDNKVTRERRDLSIEVYERVETPADE